MGHDEFKAFLYVKNEKLLTRIELVEFAKKVLNLNDYVAGIESDFRVEKYNFSGHLKLKKNKFESLFKSLEVLEKKEISDYWFEYRVFHSPTPKYEVITITDTKGEFYQEWLNRNNETKTFEEIKKLISQNRNAFIEFFKKMINFFEAEKGFGGYSHTTSGNTIEFEYFNKKFIIHDKPLDKEQAFQKYNEY